MAIAAGTRLGQYEILGLIGAGGMGEVYHGHDTKLDRDVAIKVLPIHFARDPERLARFRREATLLASLNHPNIAQIYGVEDSGDTHYLVMEFVPGLTLAERVIAGPVEVDEALRLASQMAEALEHAHEKTVIHRDLKPANVKVTPEGKVKVLDFGLAKAFAGDSAASAPPPVIDSNSPTLTSPPKFDANANANLSPTLPGVILGTAAYMSPEQAKGKTVDRRTDIWALGCVLYELLTARPAFTGDSVTEILGAIHYKEPDWGSLPEATPPAIRALLRRCLQKDAAKRSRDASEIHIQIEEARAASSAVTQTVVMQAPAPAPRRWLLLAALACLLTAAIGGIAVWNLHPQPATTAQPVTRFTVTLGAGDRLVFGGGTANLPALALSPDGKQLAYVASRGGGQTQLYLRAMDSLEARPVTSMAEASYPFFSPDGLWVGFFVAQTLRRVSTSGGAPLTITSAVNTPYGFTWGPNDTIAFAATTTSGLFTVAGSGGTPQILTELKGENSHRWPQFLPEGKAVLFTNWITGADSSQIMAQQLDTGERRVVVQGGTFPRYVPTGHLVFARAGLLMAVPFDPVRLEAKGAPLPVVEGVMQNASGAAMFSFSDTGTLVYVPGGLLEVQRQLVWVDRRGAEQPLTVTPRAFGAPVVSPDGRRVAVGIQGNIWIFDILRGTLSQLTFDGGASGRPLWSPDGTRVAYSSSKGGPPNLWWKPADGTGAEEQVTKSETFYLPSSISPERIAAYVETRPETNRDIYVQSLEGDGKPRPWLQTRFDETVPIFSPDGKWIAYVSNESGRYDIFVQPFPGPGGKWLVSTEGGEQPQWNPNGKELFYRNGDKQMAAEITTEPAFTAGTPKMLFEGRYERSTGPGPAYSVSPDGQRFLMVKAAEQQDSSATQINVVLNWFEELKAKVPVK